MFFHMGPTDHRKQIADLMFGPVNMILYTRSKLIHTLASGLRIRPVGGSGSLGPVNLCVLLHKAVCLGSERLFQLSP